MDKKEHDKITAFDTLFTNNHIQMLKIVMPYLDNPMRKKLAVYIKYLELQHTLAYYNSPEFELRGCSIEKEEFNIGKICSEILPLCTNEEKQKIEQIAGLFRTMEMYKEMSKTFEMMKEFFPEGFGDGFPFGGSPDGTQSSGGNGMMDMLMNNKMMDMFTNSNMSDMFKNNNTSDMSKNNNTSDMSANNNMSDMFTNNNMMDMLMNMLSPEQKTMFEMFGGNNNHESE